MITTNYNINKAIEGLTYLLQKAGGSFDRYLLLKMMYMTEREAWLEWGRPFTGDTMYCLDKGQILSQTVDCINPSSRNGLKEVFEKYFDFNNTNVSLKSAKAVENLSKREMKLLDKMFDQHHSKSFKEMKDYSHSLKEFVDPNKSNLKITVEDLLLKNGIPEAEVKEIECEIQESEYVNQLLADA